MSARIVLFQINIFFLLSSKYIVYRLTNIYITKNKKKNKNNSNNNKKQKQKQNKTKTACVSLFVFNPNEST